MKRCIVMGIAAAVLTSIAAYPVQTYGATVSSGTVKAKSGFVRSSASAQSAVSFCVSSGNQVAILGEEKGKDGKTWYKVAVGTSVGYIRSDLVSKTNKKVNVSDALVKNSQASSSSNKAATAASTTTAVSTASTAKTAATAASSGTVKGTYVRMRKNASLTSGVVTYLNPGDTVSILAEGKASDGAIWYQVRCKDQTGFIRSDLITKTAAATTTSTTAAAATAAGTAATTTTATASATPTAASGNTVKTIEPGTGLVKGTNVRIRSLAGTTGNIVGTVSTGAELKLMGVERQPTGNG